MHRDEHYEEEDKPFDFQNFLNKFLRRKKLFLIVAIPIFLFSVINQLRQPYTPIYRAIFDIGVVKGKAVEGFFSTSGAQPAVQIGTVTQRVIASLLSVNLAEKVVERIHLYAYVTNGHSDIKVEVKLKEKFDRTIGPLTLKITDGKYLVLKDGKKLGEGRFRRFWILDDDAELEYGILDEYIDLGSFELRVTPLREIPSGSTYELTVYPTDKMALALRNSLSIEVLGTDRIVQEVGSSGIPSSGEGASRRMVTAPSLSPGLNLIGVLRIAVHWANRDDALRIAEALSEQILLEDRSEKSQHFIQSRTFIDSQLTLYQNKLHSLEEGIKGFKERKNITDLQASTKALIGQISDLESRKNQLEIEQEVLRDLGSYLSTSPGSGETELNYAASLVSDPGLQSIYSQLLQAEAALKVALNEYSSNHPKVLEITAQLAGLKEQMRESVKKRKSTINTEIASFARQIRILQARLENVPDDEIQLARLGRDRETAEKLYTFFAEKLEETRVQEAAVTSDLRIINPPMLSAGRVNTRGIRKGIVMALVLAIVAGGFAVFVADYMDRTVRDPEKVAARLRLPVFVSIPIVNEDKVKRKAGSVFERLGLTTIIDSIRGIENKAIFEGPVRMLNGDMSSPEFEAFRKLSISLDSFYAKKRYTSKKQYRVIYVTSPGPGDGKTFITVNLGIALASKGKLVVVVDTDFRKKTGHLTDAIRVKKDVGLFNVLRGEVKLMDAIFELKPKSSRRTVLHSMYTDDKNISFAEKSDTTSTLIDFMPIGRIPTNPFVYLESEEMVNIINVLKDTYDYVIIDGVPVLLFADASYVSTLADGVLLAARYAKTGLKELENTKEILVASKLHNIGLVMNGVPKSRGSYYYDYYYKHYSKYYRSG